ncbi:MAG: metallophosphoesterase family protein [Bacteroidota bacterium]
MKKYKYILYFLLLLAIIFAVGKLMEKISVSENKYMPAVPAVHSNIEQGDKGLFFKDEQGRKWQMANPAVKYTKQQFQQAASGTKQGVAFDFTNEMNGILYYGFIDRAETAVSLPVFYKQSTDIKHGKAEIDLVKAFSGKYDIVSWQQTGRSELAYRVVDEQGDMLYDGRLFLVGTGPFKIGNGIISGPFVSKVTDNQAVLSFETRREGIARVAVDGRILDSPNKQHYHEIRITGLQPDSVYNYHVLVDDYKFTSSFKTALADGSRKPFSFGFTSGSRGGKGGGERNIGGVNAYKMKRLAAFAEDRKLAFWQFTGDMIDGYRQNRAEARLQYANWKRAIEPFAHKLPIFVGMGNHEALTMNFTNAKGQAVRIDRFPYASHSAEAIFAQEFANFENGPGSEDGASYDPVMVKRSDPDFPSYKENVYAYRWANSAMIVLNSNYWYAPTRQFIPQISGNPHGYIMDVQMKWLRMKIMEFEQDNTLDHVFVTLHAPLFPNGGHTADDMWYDGDNSVRPYIAGSPHSKGIIERRDELLDILVNQSTKTAALLCGDEHNYSRLRIHDTMPRYPENYDKKKIRLKRPVLQLTNGAAGAPFSAKEKLPWSSFVDSFSTQNVMIMFHVNGPEVRVEVMNPETFQQLDYFILKNSPHE